MGENYVLQKWMGEIPLKQQSVLLSSLRGPDNTFSHNIKKITKWIRATIQKNADPSNNKYMHPEGLPLIGEVEKDLEYCTVHYAVHLLSALEIIGYQHPDKKIASIANNYYNNLVSQTFNMRPETRKQLNCRLEDRI